MLPRLARKDGRCHLSYRPKEKLPITDYTEKQGRFAHLAAPANAELLAALQKDVDERWERLVRRCEEDEPRIKEKTEAED